MSKTCFWLATGLVFVMVTSQTAVAVAELLKEIDVMEGVREIKDSTMEKCAKACVKEKAIKCKYFKFVNSTKSCFLSESKHPGTSTRRADVPVDASKSLLEHEVEEMWQDMKSFQTSSRSFEKFEKAVMKELDSRAREIQALKESGIKEGIDISHLKRMVNSLVSNSHQLAGGIGDLQASQKNLRNQVSDMRRTNGKMVSGMSKLDIRTQELGGKLDTIGMTSIEVVRKLNNFQEDYMKLQRNVENLIGDRTGTVEVVKKVNSLSDAEINLNDVVTDLKDKQETSQNLLKDVEGYTKRLADSIKSTERQQQDVNRKMDNMQMSNKELERQLKTLKTSEAGVNTKLQGEIEGLLKKVDYQSEKSKDLQEQSSSGKQNLHNLHTSLQKMAQLHSNLKIKLERFMKNSTRLMDRINQKTVLEADDIRDLKGKQTKLFTILQQLVKDGEELSGEVKKFPVQLELVSDGIERASQAGDSLSAKVKILEGETTSIETSVGKLKKSMKQQKMDFPKEALINIRQSQVKLSKSIDKLAQTQRSAEDELEEMEREVKRLNKTARVKSNVLKDIEGIKMENAMIAQLALDAARSSGGDNMSIMNEKKIRKNIEHAIAENEVRDILGIKSEERKDKQKHKHHRKHKKTEESSANGKKTKRAAKKKKSKGRKTMEAKDEIMARKVRKSKKSSNKKSRTNEINKKTGKSANRSGKLTLDELEYNPEVEE